MSRTRTLSIALLALFALGIPATADAAKPKRQLYVSLGDSYATGFQPSVLNQAAGTRNGFAYQIPGLAKKRGYRYELVNFGCGGATTTSLLEQTEKCAGPGPGGKGWGGRSQIAAAERFIRANKKRVGLISVSIGGNDVTACVREADPIPCVVTAVQTIQKNVTEIADRLRKAAGKKPRIVGITYPNVILGQWVGANADQDLARLANVAFKDFINPTLKKAYESADGDFVDVTAASGAYGSLEETTSRLGGWGSIPVPVAKVCELTFYCEYRDIHARTSGYKLIAELIVKTLPRR